MLGFLEWVLAMILAQPVPGWTREEPLTWVPAAAVAAALVFGAVAGRRARARVAADPDAAYAVLSRSTNVSRVTSLAAFGAMTQLGGLGTMPWLAPLEGTVLLPHVAALLPFAALRVVGKVLLEPARRIVSDATFPRALAADARAAMLPLAPLLAVSAAFDVLALAPAGTLRADVRDLVFAAPSVQALGMLGLATCVMLAIPFVLRTLWRATPLAPGPLRTRLEAYSRRVGFRARDILVWPTGGHAMNAAVVGIVGPCRYVFVTDGLLDALGDDEVEAVFAHEAGHGRRGHILLFLGFSATLALAGFLPGGMAEAFGRLVEPVPPLVRALAVVVVWMGVVLGWISRRFEQEADVFGLDTVRTPPRGDGAPADGGDHPFVRALERIAAQVGGIREVTGWRHFSIADRVAFVRAYLGDAAVRRRHKRQLALLRGALIVLPIVAVAAAAARVPQDLDGWRSRGMLRALQTALTAPDAPTRAAAYAAAARSAWASGRRDDALRWWRESVLAGAGDDVREAYRDALLASGRPLGAAALTER